MNRALLAAAVLLAGIAWPALAATPIPPGKWSFVFTDAKGRADRPIRVYTYRPVKCDTRCPIVFVMHGVKRNASAYRDYWELLADEHRLLIVAPEFAARHWPGEQGYNHGGVEEEADREKWALSAIEHLFDEVRDGHNGYAIFGHSAGGQFVQRMALFLPDNRASVMVAANPGFYTMPEWRKDKAVDAYPYSLVQSAAGEGELRRALERRFVLMLGDKDIDPNHKELDRSPGAMKQGANRLERGENFFKAATVAAGELGVRFGWQLVEVPNVNHSAARMSQAAAAALYGSR